MPIHWGDLWGDESNVNDVTQPLADPQSHQPELKVCAVRIEASHWEN
jgi:ferredoxin-nitrate reductase